MVIKMYVYALWTHEEAYKSVHVFWQKELWNDFVCVVKEFIQNRQLPSSVSHD